MFMNCVCYLKLISRRQSTLLPLEKLKTNKELSLKMLATVGFVLSVFAVTKQLLMVMVSQSFENKVKRSFLIKTILKF